ncbi:PspA/IM30 family protein [Jannaschia pagri]|uniref:PspA/IM30 family protein n=1 Tax=Jannaschia pagri TaxID=2829797 RepID=UPI0021060A20|nr:PspA/IM30 family protein [Jannaschia sp. AI_62]
MLQTLSTLLRGASARAEEATRDRYAIELIDQKIREADTALRTAKAGLASLIQRERAERRQLDALTARTADLTERARQALADGRDDLAAEAAEAIARQEDEANQRQETLARLEARVIRLRGTVETAHRRLFDLRQGATAARALRREQDLQTRLRSTNLGQSPAAEAQDLIDRVLSRDDPGEEADILSDIDRDLNDVALPERLADGGYGPPTRTRAADVLARLKTQN